MIRSEETVRAVERAAAEERGMAEERGALAADLTDTRCVLDEQMGEIDRQSTWWQQRYPGDPVASLLADRQVQAVARVGEVIDRIAEVVKEQQAHEVAASELAEEATRMRAEWEARTRPDEPGPARTPADRGGVLPQMSGACLIGQHQQCQGHGEGYPSEGSCQCSCPAEADQTREDVKGERNEEGK